MTTKTDSFTVTENPLSTNWTTGAANGCRAAGSGAFATAVAVCVSHWKTSDYAFANDQSAEVTITNPANFDNQGCVVRWASTGGGVGYKAMYYHSTSQVKIERWAAGANAADLETIGSTTFSSGDKLKLEVTGTSLRAYKNGVAIGTGATNAVVASGQPGISYDYGNANAVGITLFTGVDAVGTPNITSISTATPREGASLTITGTAFGASQGSGDVKINGVAQTVTAWSDTSITVTVVLGANKFGAAYTVVVRDNALTASNSYAGITGLQPENSGLSYIDVGTPHADPDLRLESTADAVSGDQVEWENIGLLVDVFSDLTFAAGPGVNSFRWRLWTSGSGYGPWVTQRTGGASGAQRLAMSLAIGL